MTLTLLELPIWLLGGGMVGLAVALTLVGARRSARQTSPPSDAVAPLQATISTIYTVLLAFVVVIVWQQFSDADRQVQVEATRLHNILRDSRVFDEPARTELHDAVVRYTEVASTREWDAMAHGDSDRVTHAAFNAIWDVVYRLQPSGVVQEAFHRELLTKMNDLGDARRVRLLSAQTSVTPVLWFLLLGGGGLVMYVSCLLPGGSAGRGRSAALAATGCLITLTLFVIFVFDNPFAGSVRVDPSPLRDILPP